MAARWFGGFLLLVLLWETNCQGPPKVDGSYKAVGEMVETLEDSSALLTQVAFEESYDADTRNAAFTVWILGMNVTFVENYKTNQTFRYNTTDCVLMSSDEWVKTKSPPSLLAYEDTNGTVRFSLKQLFSLDDKLLKVKNETDVFRGIPARKWMYEIKGDEPETGERMVLSIYAYWSEQSWSTTSNKDTVPLGYIVTKMTYNKKKSKRVKVHEQFINVYSFVPGIINHKLFEPIQGIQCKDRLPSVPFPDVSKLSALAIHSEVVFPDYLEIKYVDAWLDTKNKLFRSDMERISDEEPESRRKTLKYQSEIAIAKMGVVFKVGYNKGMFACSVIPFDEFQFDIQSLFNFRLPQQDWQIGKMFGLNDTKYVYTGKTSKRGIPCHVFQGLRKDWPYPEAKVTSLWDWCFSLNLTQKDKGVMFRNGEYGLVNAQVKILESGSPGDIPTDFRLIHHFYDVNVKDPGLMDATNFDLSRCFEEHEKRYLQFKVDWKITTDNLLMVENATSDVTFLQKWKEAIYTYSGLDSYSLRVTQVQSVVNEKTLYVKFVILAPHDGLPKDIKKAQKTGFLAENMFRDNVNDGKVSINYQAIKGAQAIKLGVVQHSLESQISNKFEPHTVPPTSTRPPTSRATFTFSLITDPKDGTTTTAGTTDSTTGKIISSKGTTRGTSTTKGRGTTKSKTTTKIYKTTTNIDKITTKHYKTTTKRYKTTSSRIPDTTTGILDITSGITDTTRDITDTDTTPKDSSTTNTPPTVSTPFNRIHDADLVRHGAGTVVGVSIAMLLVGISMGSAGVFVKYHGMPACITGST